MPKNAAARERIAFLRRRLAAAEARAELGGRASMPKPMSASVGPPRPASIEQWLRDPALAVLSEIAPARPRDAGAAAAFTGVLAARAIAARPRLSVVWIGDDMAAREIGLPYGGALRSLGLDLARFVFVRARRDGEALWAMEEALKTRAAAVVVAESWLAPGAYGLVASRRLLMAARRGGGLGLLLLPRAAGQAQRLIGAAPLRLEIAALPPPLPSSAQARSRPPPPPLLGWRLRVVKARADLFGEVDPRVWRDISFNALSLEPQDANPERFFAPSADRPDFARAAGGGG